MDLTDYADHFPTFFTGKSIKKKQTKKKLKKKSIHYSDIHDYEIFDPQNDNNSEIQDNNGNLTIYDKDDNKIIIRYADRLSLPQNCQKYWKQRYSIFSKFNDNIRLTSELWYSVTPEAIADYIASYIKQNYTFTTNTASPQKTSILDVFAGGGGNSIQFAYHFDKVIAIDINFANLYCLKQNSKVYQINEKIETIQKDWSQINDAYLLSLKKDYNINFIFASPPWGGPEYLNKDTFDLQNDLKPFSLTDLLSGFLKITKNIGLFLPRNSDLNQLNQITKDLFGENSNCFVAKISLRTRTKGYCCFWC
ncbi:RNA methyltransferase ASCRUDRAFT_75686 [Ascoidea rubescens DSM 1968]|uniref:Trimethylguanosine synthase n=1 Tax=Ascoidea rubescens DSM 1968 TaxID=1344418 RepID=A0A1D2VJG3_9ASCO|nr:hypothetical protein ASCRUDRAFT_75686 [Ascoidea rubescens DSM 1968]ODV61713.1 hypothetical protein ASCRUDRAFT_75686 [Ascoidea rubescens DSM 1968]